MKKMKLNQNIKEIEHNIDNQFDENKDQIEEYIAGLVLYHHNNTENISEAAQRHENTEKEELKEWIEEFTDNTLGETNEIIQKKVINLVLVE